MVAQSWRRCMSNTVNVELKLKASGIKEANVDAKDLRDNIEGAVKASAKMAQGTAGSRAARQASVPKASYEQAKEENRGYNTQRAVGPGTGSATSDFARQATGLGGLVHVYATFAANLFAASAAFNMLSKAMDTSNLVRGLDQIGAATGRNLGSVAKQMVAAADGAISLRDAMSSTAMASSAGMTNDAIIRMTKVAQKASLALGRDMSDSMDRLTKGIAKTQPELLDELGIMTRVIPAQQEYARQIGKTAASLTDFEKKQAFANAVLEEGERKFGSINLDSNPYSKLSASLSNLTQTGLEFVNKFLGPVTSALSASPAGLATAMGLVASVLLKQAIPAIGMFRENAKRMADETRARVARQLEDQLEASVRSDTIAAEKAERDFRRSETTFKKIGTLHKEFNRSIIDKAAGAGTRDLLRKSPFDLTAEDMSRIKLAHQKLAADTSSVEEKAQAIKISKRLEGIEAINSAMKKAGDDAAEANEKSETTRLSHRNQKEIEAAKLTRQAIQRDILSNASNNAAVMGPTFAFKTLREELAKTDANKFSKGMTLVKGSLSIATSAVSTFLGAFGAWFQIAGLVIAGGTALFGYFTKTAKEAEATATALDTLKQSGENVSKTLDVISNKDFLGQLSVESIQARATALNDLVGSLATAVAKSNTELAKIDGSPLNKATNFISKLWGGDVQSKLNENLGTSVIQAFSVLEKGPTAEKAKAVVSNILGKSIKSSKDVENALSDMSDKGKSAILQLVPALQTVAREAGNTAAKGTELKAAYAESYKTFQNFINSTKDTSPLSQLGEVMLIDAQKLAVALEDPAQALQAMQDIANDPKKLVLFPESAARSILQFGGQLTSLNEEQARSVLEISKLGDEIEALEKKKAEYIKNTKSSANKEGKEEFIKGIDKDIAKAIKSRQAIQVDVDANISTSTSRLKEVFTKAVQEQALLSAQIVTTKLNESWTKAGATVGSTIAGMLGDTKAGIELRNQYEKQALAAQASSIKVQLDLIKANERVAVELELSRLAEEKSRINPDNMDASEIRRFSEREKTLTYRKEALEDNPIKQGATAAVSLDMANGVAGAKEVYEYLKRAEEASAALAGVNASMKASDIKAKIESNMLDRKNKAEKQATDIEGMRLDQERLALAEAAAGVGSMSLLNLKHEKAEKLAIAEAALKLYNIDTDINKLGLLKANQNSADAAKTQADIDEKKKAKGETEANLKKGLATGQLRNQIESIAKAEEIRVDLLNRSIKASQLEASIASDRREIASSDLDYRKLVLATTEEEYLKQKNIYDIEKLREDARSKSQEIEGSSSKEVGAIQQKIDTQSLNLGGFDETSAEYQEIDKIIVGLLNQKMAIEESTKRELTSLALVLSKRVEITDKTTQYNQLLARQTEQMNTLVDVTASLASLFGEVGENIGKAGEAMLKLSQNAELRAKAEQGKSGEDLEKLRKKHTQAELKDIAALAAASKKSLGERTTAGKAAAAIERGAQLEKLSLQAKESVFTEQNMQKAKEGITAFMDKVKDGTVVDGIAAVVKQGVGGDPWTAIPRMIAMASFISSLTGESISGPTPIDQGTMAGTGQLVGADGQTIGTRAGGVLGDPKAQAKSITDSIENLSHVFFGTMGSSSSSLLKHLRGIQDNTYNTAKALGAAGSLGTGNPFGAAVGDFKAFNTGIGVLDNLLGNIFGGNTSQSITGSGIRGSGTSSSLAQDASRIEGYTNIRTETSGGWFSSGSSSNTTVLTKLDNAITKGLQGIFTNFNEVLLDTAGELGRSRTEIQSILDTTSIELNVSNAGLTGTEFAQKLSAEVSVQLNKIAEQAYPFITAYTKVGEESFQTATRIIKDSETVTYGLNMVGDSITGLLTVQEKIAKQQQIIENFGGTADEFASAIQAYYDALFSDSEKAITSFANMSTQLAYLGIAGVSTNAQLKELIGSIDPTEELYASLVKLVPAFESMTSALQKMQDSFDSLQVQAYDLIANTLSNAGAVAEAAAEASRDLKRATTLNSIDPTLKSMQEYVYALEDLQDAEAKLAAIRKKNLQITKKTSDDQINVLKTSISTMEGFITSLENFKDSLLLGAQSILNPQDKYAEASRQFYDVLATATGTATTPEEQKLRDAALSQIQTSATAFLDASRLYNASSSQYTTDFNVVQDALSGTATSLKLQKSTAQTTLDELTAQSTLLQSQLDALDNVTSAIEDTTSAVEAVVLATERVATALGVATADKAAYDAKLAEEATKAAIEAALVTSSTALTDAIATGNSETIAAAVATAMQSVSMSRESYASDLGYSSSITGGTTEESAWSKLSDYDKSQYMKDSPISSAISGLILKALSYTTIGSIVKALDPTEYAKQELIAAGNFSGTFDASGQPIAQSDIYKLTGYTELGSYDNQASGATSFTEFATNFISGITSMFTSSDATTTGLKLSDSTVGLTASVDSLATSLTSLTTTTNALVTAAAETVAQVTEPTASTYQSSYTTPYTYSYNYSSYNSDSDGYSGYATGGLAPKGTHIVGELGPELVDFTTPGRVYTAQETFGMFNGGGSSVASAVGNMTREIIALKQELAQLRKEQQEQTGHIITANYDANSRNATTVATATEEASKASIWATRQTVAIV